MTDPKVVGIAMRVARDFGQLSMRCELIIDPTQEGVADDVRSLVAAIQAELGCANYYVHSNAHGQVVVHRL